MSTWTHVLGTIEIDVYGGAQYECEYNLKRVLEHLPIVYGSEENMYITSFVKPGYCTASSNTDEFDKHSNLGQNGRGGLFEFQTRYILVLSGDLQDATYEQTYRSLIKCIRKIIKHFYLIAMNITIFEEFGRTGYISSTFEDDGYWWELSCPVVDKLAFREYRKKEKNEKQMGS